MNVLSWFTDNAVGLGIFGAVFTAIWSIIRYMLERRRKARAREFDVFHRLIKELVSGDSGNGETKSEIKLDRQAAIVFELRNFPRYYEFTCRTMKSLKEQQGKRMYPPLGSNRLEYEDERTRDTETASTLHGCT